MIDLLYIAAIYILAVIGVIALLGVLVVLYICYRYDINIYINSHGKGKPIEITKNKGG